MLCPYWIWWPFPVIWHDGQWSAATSGDGGETRGVARGSLLHSEVLETEVTTHMQALMGETPALVLSRRRQSKGTAEDTTLWEFPRECKAGKQLMTCYFEWFQGTLSQRMIPVCLIRGSEMIEAEGSWGIWVT